MWYVFGIILINWLIYISKTIQQNQASLRLRHDLFTKHNYFNMVQSCGRDIFIYPY